MLVDIVIVFNWGERKKDHDAWRENEERRIKKEKKTLLYVVDPISRNKNEVTWDKLKDQSQGTKTKSLERNWSR